MNYGLWLSATGVVTSNHQTDVIANNLANSETTGFKRQLATTMERLPEALENPGRRRGNPLLDGIGGGQLMSPSHFDLSDGVIEPTDRNLDVAITGDGFFAVQDAKGNTRLTRNGNFMLDRAGRLVLATGSGEPVLDADRRPIELNLQDVRVDQIRISPDGTMAVGAEIIGKVGLFTTDRPLDLRPIGGTLFKVPDGQPLKPSTASANAGFLERSNVDPTVELTRLMENQRLLEANANMIRFQDQTLSTLVNTVGKIG
jgi:flagellar basal-body rod protein FlgF